MFGKRSARTNRGRSGGLLLILSGVIMAAASALLVFTMTEHAQAAVTDGSVQHVQVVVARRDIQQLNPIKAADLTLKQFPAAFIPQGAVLRAEDVVGKFATTHIIRDQLVMTAHVSQKPAINLSAKIPDGKVAYWLTMPEQVVQAGGIQVGDHIDLLLSLPLSKAGSGQAPNAGKGIATNTTLQNVEVAAVGQAPTNAPAARPGGTAPQNSKASPTLVVVLDPQEALLVKSMKDSGGTVDIALRASGAAADPKPTEPVTVETLVDRFDLRLPERYSAGK